MTNKTTVRILFLSTWADGLEDAQDYLATLPGRELSHKVSRPGDVELMRMARLDRDWDAECLRCFAAMRDDAVEFLPALVVNAEGLIRFTMEGRLDEAQPWLVSINQRPAAFAPVIGRMLEAFTDRGGRVLYWAYDEASRNMDCFAAGVAPYLSVLIHDESPLDAAGARALSADCLVHHESWVANVVPFAYPFCEEPKQCVVFLGSQLGVTPHRLRQIEALGRHFKDRFLAITDHSVPVSERGRFPRFKVHVCPEGRKFTSPGMSRTHTDRPFWAGAMGQVPVSENSSAGGRLDALAEAGMILRYPHGDLDVLVRLCEQALGTGLQERRRIYEHFNRFGTVGPMAARRIAEFHAGLRHDASARLATAPA